MKKEHQVSYCLTCITFFIISGDGPELIMKLENMAKKTKIYNKNHVSELFFDGLTEYFGKNSELIDEYIDTFYCYYLTCKKMYQKAGTEIKNIKNKKDFCRHFRKKTSCLLCSRISCKHFVTKSSCKICNLRMICKNEQCNSVIFKYNSKYCLKCMSFSEEINSKREYFIAKKIVDKFCDIDWTFNKQINRSSTNYRPDLIAYRDNKIILIEIDERQHLYYKDERRRIKRIHQDMNNKPLIVVRVNIDKYIRKGKLVDPMILIKNDSVYIPNKREYDKRMSTMYSKIEKVLHMTTFEKPITIFSLFYTRKK